MRCKLFAALLFVGLVAPPSHAGEACEAWKTLTQAERSDFLKDLAEAELQWWLHADALKGVDWKCFRAGYPAAVEPFWVASCEKLEWSDYQLGRAVEGAIGLLADKCTSP